MTKNKLIIIYEAVKSLIVILLSLCLFNKFDLGNFITFIPQENISINITIYGVLITFIISMFEIYFKSNRIKVDAKVVSKKDKLLSCKIPIEVNDKSPQDIYIIINISGTNKKKLNNKGIVVKFPSSITIQPDSQEFLMTDNNFSEYELHIDLLKIANVSGTTGIPISLLKEKPTKVIREVNISPELKISWWEHIFIDFNYETTLFVFT